MTGRGIDQILPSPCDPRLHEPWVRNAGQYVELAEDANGPIPRPVPFDYIWGDALRELEARRPAARVVNLETSVTAGDRPAPKGINYRMHPGNLPCLEAAGIDCCALANNHVLDWQQQGMDDTLDSLAAIGIRTAGAGANAGAAAAPAILPLGEGGRRLLVFSAAAHDSGAPPEWAADVGQPGINRLPALSEATLQQTAEIVDTHRRPEDIVVFSIHWGGNWGFEVPEKHRRFARGLVDTAGVDLVHGHSSHHVKGFEVHANRLILYGCGDFLTDYEGIGGHERFRGDLGLMYFPTLDEASGELIALETVPTRIRRLRIERATARDRAWLAQTLHRECRYLGTTLATGERRAFILGH